MAYRAARTLSTNRFALACALALISAGAWQVAAPASAQEPAPATAPSSAATPPPPNWGGAESTAAQPAAVPGQTFDSTSTTTTTTTSQSPAAGEPDSLKDPGPHQRPHMVSAFTGFYFGTLSRAGFPMLIGGRYLLPLVADGFLPTLNDEFGLEFGLDLSFTFLSSRYSDTLLFGFGVPVDAYWDLHISPRFDAYVKAGFSIGSGLGDYGSFWWDFRTSVGLRLKLNDTMYFRAEVGYPTIMAGLGFAL
jgi:hypothetical protein